ncbi:cytochrome c oxidase subunit 8C, mitochondrial-like [Macaca nemestrina]|uniref:cytochrome c oxidase subunit 8C, mitochondrial-like n=1 Tax=Macaca nemestrina TaxID=9545 RepID=UPI0039B8CACB
MPLLPGLCPVCRHYRHMALPELQPALLFAPSQSPRQQSLLATHQADPSGGIPEEGTVIIGDESFIPCTVSEDLLVEQV